MFDISAIESSDFIVLWMHQKSLEIQNHSAWHWLSTEQEAEMMLKDQTPFTYLLRAGEKPGQFVLSFVPQHTSFSHQIFHLERSFNGWFYRNGDPHIAKTLQELVPMIMHCSESECIPFASRSQIRVISE